MELKRIENNFVFYHGCGMYHLDGSNILIRKGQSCILPTKKCFWKRPNYINKKIYTRSREKSAKIYFNLMSLPCNKIKKELIEYNQQTFHSSDSDSDSDTDSSLNSEESMYDSDSNDLIIDETTN